MIGLFGNMVAFKWFNFDKTGDRYFGNNFNLSKHFDRMDRNEDDFIDLDDIIRVEIVEKDSDEKRNNYFERDILENKYYINCLLY